MTDKIYTIGHSTHSADLFIKTLVSHAIELVVDVRSIPRSRHNPQFNKDELESDLRHQGIGYVHLKELGGLRHTSGASINTGWTNLSFRGFADYMQTPEFNRGIEMLIEASYEKRSVIMCAETLPWRCHRSLIADALTVRGIAVEHIMSGKTTRAHEITPWARVDGTAITYPGPARQTGIYPAE